MSLTHNDLQQIRGVIREEVRGVIKDEVREIVREEVRVTFRDEVREIVRDEVAKSTDILSGKIEALEADIKELYFMVGWMEKGFVTDPQFKKLPEEEQILRVNAWLIEFAKRKGVALPR